MVLKGEFAIGLLHLIVRGIRTDTQHLIGILECITFEVQHRVDLCAAEAHPLRTFLQGRDLTLGHRTVGLGHHHKIVQELQTLGIVHLLVNLSATLTNGRLKLRPTLALLLFEELVQDIIALIDGIRTEVLTEHLAHHLHLRMHRLAIGLDDIRRKHQQREKEAVAPSLLLTLTIGLLIGLIIVLIGFLLPRPGIPLRARAPCTRIAGRVHPVEHRVKERTYQITRQCPQRATSHPSDKSANPLACCHIQKIISAASTPSDRSAYCQDPWEAAHGIGWSASRKPFPR